MADSQHTPLSQAFPCTNFRVININSKHQQLFDDLGSGTEKRRRRKGSGPINMLDLPSYRIEAAPTPNTPTRGLNGEYPSSPDLIDMIDKIPAEEERRKVLMKHDKDTTDIRLILKKTRQIPGPAAVTEDFTQSDRQRKSLRQELQKRMTSNMSADITTSPTKLSDSSSATNGGLWLERRPETRRPLGSQQLLPFDRSQPSHSSSFRDRCHRLPRNGPGSAQHFPKRKSHPALLRSGSATPVVLSTQKELDDKEDEINTLWPALLSDGLNDEDSQRADRSFGVRPQNKRISDYLGISPIGNDNNLLDTVHRPVSRQKLPKEALDLFPSDAILPPSTSDDEFDHVSSSESHDESSPISPSSPTFNSQHKQKPSKRTNSSVDFSCLFIDDDDEFTDTFPTRGTTKRHLNIKVTHTDWSPFNGKTPDETEKDNNNINGDTDFDMVGGFNPSEVIVLESLDCETSSPGEKYFESLYDLLVQAKNAAPTPDADTETTESVPPYNLLIRPQHPPMGTRKTSASASKAKLKTRPQSGRRSILREKAFVD